ncbi:hypothetical protein GF351_05915 [Candidatus Woesearchaeota archaeon]|nr:hypothetical protein [Candidatus Woesearchaeota archaeon]
MVNKLTILQVLEPFLSKPKEKLHLSEISRAIGTPHPTVRQWLNIMEKKGVLKKGFKGRLTLYSLNTENKSIINYLAIAEKNNLIKRCEQSLILKELTDFIQFELKENTKALIFGSAAETFDKAEDVDMIIIGKMDEKKITSISKHINKEIHLINVSSLEKISRSLKEEIIKKHLIISGDEEIIRWMIWQQ